MNANAKMTGSWILLAVALTIAGTWLCLLPVASSLPAYREYGDLLDTHGVDASAMFYTELPNLDRTLERVESLHRREPLALWTWDQGD